MRWTWDPIDRTVLLAMLITFVVGLVLAIDRLWRLLGEW